MTADQKQVALATQIYKKTMTGELEWKPTVNDDMYQIPLSQYTVRIMEVTRGRELLYMIELVNPTGTVADAFSDRDLAATNFMPPNSNTWWTTLSEVYNRARRVALGADKAIDDILSELTKDDEIPF